MSISHSLLLWLIRIRMRSWELAGESCVVLLGFLTLVVSLGNLSTRGLQVCSTGNTGNPAPFEISHLDAVALNLFRLSSLKAKLKWNSKWHFFPSLPQSSVFASPQTSPCFSLTYAPCLVFPGSLALSHVCSLSHLYKELSTHSSGHSDESVWIKGRGHRPKLLMFLHIGNAWNADRLYTPDYRTTLTLIYIILPGSGTLCYDSPNICAAVLLNRVKIRLKLLHIMG